jgi:Ni/Fe-hydrogenase 1 B-type cytochrome subunit
MAHLAHYKEAHPLPFVLTHWINLVSMILLIITGLCIHFPFFPLFMGIARGVHIACGFIVIINCVLRVILAFVLKSSPVGGSHVVDTDYKSFLPQKDNRHQGGPWIKYYLFMKKDHPLGAKYGVPQKITYVLVPVLILVMGYVGLCLWSPTASIGFFAAGIDLVGGAMSMRIIHYFMMFVFIIFMMLHVYLSAVEGLAPIRIMLMRKESGGLVYDTSKHTIVGEDDMGTSSHH